jgi:hypothetical protein
VAIGRIEDQWRLLAAGGKVNQADKQVRAGILTFHPDLPPTDIEVPPGMSKKNTVTDATFSVLDRLMNKWSLKHSK